MDRTEDRRRPPGERPRWVRRLLAGTRVVVLLLIGFLAGSATIGSNERERVLADLYWRDSLGLEPLFVGTTSIKIAPGEEFRVEGGLGREAILVFCSPGSERNPCGREGVRPKATPEPGGEFPPRRTQERRGRGV